MKKMILLFFCMFTFTSLSVAQDVSEKTQEELLEMARQACINDLGVSPESLANREVSIRQLNDGKGWSITFRSKPDENGLIARGNHLFAMIYSNGQVICHGGM